MKIARRAVELAYWAALPTVKRLTENDPEQAHEWAVAGAKFLAEKGWSRFLLHDGANDTASQIRFSNAAGSNKNGDIPSVVLKDWGFDLNIVGTVTYDSYPGNPRPRSKRFPSGLINSLGLPGVGAEQVKENLDAQTELYGDHPIPVRINFMATPKKTGAEAIEDVVKTIEVFYNGREPVANYLEKRPQLNISCPNVQHNGDPRKAYQESLDATLRALAPRVKELDLKLSPDMSPEAIQDLLAVVLNHSYVRSFTTFNTTTERHPVIPLAPAEQTGGASGAPVAQHYLQRQEELVTNLNLQARHDPVLLAVCGGIHSPRTMVERIEAGDGRVREVSGYTDHMYKGPRLLRRLRRTAVKEYGLLKP